MKGICKLCQLEKSLRKSHIIPEFMYQNVYNQNPRFFLSIEVEFNNPSKFNKKKEQKGIRKRLFCNECEGLLNKYETYAAKVIYAKEHACDITMTHEFKDPDSDFTFHKFIGFDYKKFKIFLNSILYRILITKEVKNIKNIEAIIEILRKSIINEDPLEPKDFGCMIQIIRYDIQTNAKNFILNAYTVNEENYTILNKLIDGFMYSFVIEENNLSKDFFLTKEGTLNIIGRPIIEDPILFQMVKQAYDVYNK